MDESHCNSSEYEYDNCGSSPTQAEQEDFEHSNGRSEACAADRDDEVTDCLHFKGKNYEDLVLEDLEGVEFKSVEEVDQFYSYYSLATGFSVRKHKADKNSEQKIRRRQLLCSREGERRSHASKKQKLSTDRDNCREDISCQSQTQTNAALSRRVTRCKCPARFTALLCKTRGVYYASEFVTEHNHDLVRPEHVRFLRSHRKVMDHDIAQVSAMRKVSIPTCQAYDLLAEQAGGYAYVGFTLKDLYNHIDSGRREILVDGDAQAAISFMNLKAVRDPYFHCFFCVDQHGRLANLYWRDSESLIDYNNFGDVLIMDTTYKTNIYSKPLAVFVGVNNHRASVLFGCALMVDETEDTYRWVISTFLSSMNGKKPVSVITDGDEAMRNAISYLIPEARQRLCAWHISKNVCSNIHDTDVQKDFFHLIYAGLRVEEWEEAWQYMVAMNGLENNKWVMGMYKKRNKWAEAFFRDNFFAGVCSTQRCERMHRNLKGGLGRTMRLYDVLPRIDKTICRMRERVIEDDCKSLNSSPVIGSHLRCIQEQIAKIYTHDVFLLLKDQIGFESKFVILGRDELEDSTCSVFELTQFNKPERRWFVRYHNNSGNTSLTCSCNLFESDGIPCCHIFAVMKSLMLSTYPKSLVLKRWTKDAGLSTSISSLGGFPDQTDRVSRYGEMMTECAQLCFAASMSDQGYEATVDALRRLNIRAKTFPVQSGDGQDDQNEGLHPNVVKDPVVCRTKGTQSTAAKANNVGNSGSGRLCGYCSRGGHNIRTCPLNKIAQANNVNAQSESGTETVDETADVSSFSEADTDVEGSRGHEPELEADDLIHHTEEARTFEFFSGYESHLARGSWSTHHGGSPHTASLDTHEAGPSF